MNRFVSLIQCGASGIVKCGKFVVLLTISVTLPSCEKRKEFSARAEAARESHSINNDTTRRSTREQSVDEFQDQVAKGEFSAARTRLMDTQDPEFRGYLKSQLDTAIGNFLREQARDNPLATLEMVLNPDQGYETFWLEVAMEGFLLVDRDAAHGWYESVRFGLDVEQNDRILLALARYELTRGEWRKAREYEQILRNEKLANAVGAEVGRLVEEEIRAITRGGPAQALEILLEENTEYEVFWIEVAVNEYLKIDVNGVLIWYRENRWRLTDSQNDRVVLSYARHAKSLNRTNEALKWTDMIQDSELQTLVRSEVGE
jgi:hypothetical protein